MSGVLDLKTLQEVLAALPASSDLFATTSPLANHQPSDGDEGMWNIQEIPSSHTNLNPDFEAIANELAAPTDVQIRNIHFHKIFRQNSFISTFKRLAEVMDRQDTSETETALSAFANMLFMDLLGEFSGTNVYGYN